MTMTMMAFMIMIFMLINGFGGGGDENHDYFVIVMNIMMRWGTKLTFASAAFLG